MKMQHRIRKRYLRNGQGNKFGVLGPGSVVLAWS